MNVWKQILVQNIKEAFLILWQWQFKDNSFLIHVTKNVERK